MGSGDKGLGDGIGEGEGDSNVEDELDEDMHMLEDIGGSPCGKGSPGKEALSRDTPSPSCSKVTDETEENVEKFADLLISFVLALVCPLPTDKSEEKSCSRLCSDTLQSSEKTSNIGGGGGREEKVSTEDVDNNVLVDPVMDEGSIKGVFK